MKFIVQLSTVLPIIQEMCVEPSLDLTRVGTVQQSHHILGLLPQTLEEGDHQIADVLCVVGGERVLVSFDGGQCEALALEFTPSGISHFLRNSLKTSS